MTKIEINGSETGVLRLFRLDLPREAVDRFTTQAGTGEWPLKYALGATRLRGSFVDVVDIRDLGEMTLSEYMVQAHGVSRAALKDMRPQIDGLGGHVLLLPSQAFDATSQTLAIAQPVSWIGTFGEDRPKGRSGRIRSASASGQTVGAPAPGGRGGSAMLKLVVLGVGIVILLVLALVLR